MSEYGHAAPLPLRGIQLPMRNGVSASVVSVPQGAPHLLDFLAQRMPGISRNEWAERLTQGLVLHEDGQAALPHQSCQPGLRLYYYRHLADEPVLPFQAQVLFEDEHLLVVDKPHLMPVTPTGRYVQQSLLVQLKRQTGCADLVPLHRIDRERAFTRIRSVSGPLPAEPVWRGLKKRIGAFVSLQRRGGAGSLGRCPMRPGAAIAVTFQCSVGPALANVPLPDGATPRGGKPQPTSEQFP